MTAPPTYPAERTALAWRRTAIAAMGTAALFVDHAATSGWHAAAVAPALAAVGLLFLAGLSFLRNTSLHHGHWAHGARVIAVATGVVLVVCAVALIIAITDPDLAQALPNPATHPSMSGIPAVTGGEQ
ncbi:DUF202 domain-containing protein [Nocardia niigatensis]|uniref:DUF202 domain-containing protein n=1 Tax=Nocardia niigatensis TaxID=209249 RepID=UPI0002ED18AB|nr:DUF202 domain-containing protein [Nocardia niigatensis]